MKHTLLLLLVLGGCQGSVDRSPPRRDVGLPPVPPPPAELKETPALPALQLPMGDPALQPPPGCVGPSAAEAGTVALPWVAQFDCAAKTATKDLGSWSRVAGLPEGIYTRGQLEWVDTWLPEGQGWQLTRTVGPSHGQP